MPAPPKEFKPLRPVTGNDDLELLDASQLAELLNVPVSWVRSATRSRSKHPIPHLKVGHYIRFQEKAVREWLEGRKRSYPKRRP